MLYQSFSYFNGRYPLECGTSAMPAPPDFHGLLERRWVRRGSVVILCLAAWLGFGTVARAEATDTEPAVKLSRGGICHERGTVHYQQTIYFQAFDSMQACLAAGGRRMGGEYGDDPPEYSYRGTQPPKDYRSYAIITIIVIAAIVV